MLPNRATKEFSNSKDFNVTKLLAALAILTLTATALAADLVVVWTNSPENPVGTQTVVSWGGVTGVYTNQVIVASGLSNVTLTNLPAGKRIYVAARAFDGTDYSIYSNEDNAKTKLANPKNLTVTP